MLTWKDTCQIFQVEEPCEICGSNNFPEFIQCCALCKLTREHVYCTRTYKQRTIAWLWACDGCRSISRGDKQNFSAKHHEAIQKPGPGQSSLLARKRVPSRKSLVEDIPSQDDARTVPFRRSRKGISGKKPF